MKIVIETPKYSFSKYRKTEEGYERAFFSPLPTIFNYGFIEGTTDPDGMKEDVVVLAPRLPRGSTFEREDFDGLVKFLDNSIRDDKRLIYKRLLLSSPASFLFPALRPFQGFSLRLS